MRLTLNRGGTGVVEVPSFDLFRARIQQIAVFLLDLPHGIDELIRRDYEASQCAGAVAPDRDPRTSGTGERANGPGECRTRISEVLRRAAAQVWHAAVLLGDHEGIEHVTTRSLGAVVARDRIAERTY
jgi:hypothetical protein